MTYAVLQHIVTGFFCQSLQQLDEYKISSVLFPKKEGAEFLENDVQINTMIEAVYVGIYVSRRTSIFPLERQDWS